jgi:hypothetical protein
MFEHAVHVAVANPPADYVREVCPDQYVGMLHQFRTDSVDFPCRQSTQASCFSGKRAILILESPHKREFIDPIGPAKGSTGSLIRRHLHEILKAYDDSDFGFFLVNAIRNQCSLGRSPKNYPYRDDVFREAWKPYGREDFVGRLRSLNDGQEIFVINACTLGRGVGLEKSRRELVEEAVREALNRASDIRITHPASWASPANRSAHW